MCQLHLTRVHLLLNLGLCAQEGSLCGSPTERLWAVDLVSPEYTM